MREPGLRCGKVGGNTLLDWVFDGSVKPSLIHWFKGRVSDGTVIGVYQGGSFTPAPGWETKITFAESSVTGAWSGNAGIIIHDFQSDDAGIYSIEPQDIYDVNENAEIQEYTGK